MGGAPASASAFGRLDEIRLRTFVSSSTLARGRAYAARGAVVRRAWDDDGGTVTGEVQGGSATPYQVTVAVRRDPASGRLAGLDARCTCPVGRNCKHAVALLLAPEPRPALTLVPASPPAPTPAAWEEPLRALLGSSGTAPGEVALGLQLELVARPVPGRRGQTTPGIRVRPVTRSPAGNWVRTGVSWSRLDSWAYGSWASGPPGAPGGEALTVLRELGALGTITGARTWAGTTEEALWLESVSSRRLWDLLRHAEELRIPLLRAGPGVLPVELRRGPAEVVVDLTRQGDGLVLRPELRSGPVTVPLDSALWIGSPPHGVAWWRGQVGATPTPELHLAPLSPPLTPPLLALLERGPLAVPPAEADRFETEVFPALRRRVGFRSSDGSVELPDDAPDTVALTLSTAEDGLAVELAWSLVDGTGAARPLDEQPDDDAARAMADAASLAAGVPGLVQDTPWGPRLAPAARLDGLAAARFVAETLPAVEAVGGLAVDRDRLTTDFRETTDAPVVRLTGSEAPGGDWFDLTVEVSVGGEDVAFQDLFVALANEQTHLLLPSGTYFALDRPELRQLAELIAEARLLHDAPGDGVRLSRYQASLWAELERLGIVSAQAGAWMAAVRALATAGAEAPRPLPRGLDATLRPYQEAGYQWLASRWGHHLGGILADDMGLGKTLQVLALVAHAEETDAGGAPFLVVAPTSVVGNWVSEAARFVPGLPVASVTETARRRGASLAAAVAGAALVVTSYTLFRLEHEEYEALDWGGLILDEAQFAKNPQSHNYQRARRLPAPFKLAVTGTPLENSLAELWALTSITAPGLFARPERFAKAYRQPIERHGDTERLDQLRRRIRPVMLRRTKAEVAADLPDKQEQVLELDLHPRHRKLYQTYLQRERQKVLGMLGDLDGHRFEIFRSLTLLRQAALSCSLVDGRHASVPSTKLDALDDMLADAVADGHRVLVFSQFTRFLTAARRRVEAAGLDCCYLDGRTTRRAEVISRFREGDVPVFLISLKAGGFGLNLTEADHCILLDPWWNPATEAQAVDRVHRIGQTRKVMVHRLVARDTIEEKVMALKARKAQLFDSVIDAGGFEGAGLSAADIAALLE